jgi:hypothetical protein
MIKKTTYFFLNGWPVLKRSSSILSSLCLVLTFFLLTIPHYVDSVRASNELQLDQGAAKIWLESAECARKTGIVLVLCRDGELVPFADGGSGDDPGHALALGIYSAVTGKSVSQADISIFNSTVNYVGITLLAVLLFCLQLPLASFLILALCPSPSDAYHMLGPHPAQFGAACFAAVLPLALLGIPVVSKNSRGLWIWIVVGIACLSVATLLRQAIGLMGVVGGCTAVMANLVMHRPYTRQAVIGGVALVTAIFASYQTPALVNMSRNMAYHLPPAQLIEQHGIWHNLYIGLGAVDNPFGINWIDGDGAKAASRVDPTVVYLSARYFAILRHEYFRILTQHPIEVAVVYLRKLGAVLNTRITPPLNGSKLWQALVPLLLVAVYARRFLWFRRSGWFAADVVFAIGALYAALFIAQGVLFHYSQLYLFPIYLFLLLCVGAIAEFLRSGLARPVPVSPSAPIAH